MVLVISAETSSQEITQLHEMGIVPIYDFTDVNVKEVNYEAD